MILTSKRFMRTAAAAALALFISGCSSHHCHLCSVAPPSSEPWEPVPPPTYFCGDDFGDDDRAEIETFSRNDAHQDGVNLLLLSGGGSRGSFGSGILYGWEESPEFDMVTGISTGAIMATWAYLGRDHPTEPYEIMKQSYDGTLTDANIRKRRWLFPFVDSLYSLEPLRKTLERVIPTAMLIEVGTISRDTGRQLWIGTTNVETGQFCHWNLGERAEAILAADEKGDQETVESLTADYHNLILASSANPTVFKAIPVNHHGGIPAKGERFFYHVDGGVSDTIYVEQLGHIADSVERARQSNPELPLNVYAIVNGRLVTSQQCLQSGAAPIAIRSINLLSKSSLRGNLNTISVTMDEKLSTPRKDGGWTLKVASIDYRLPLTPADAFIRDNEGDKLGMAALFNEGVDWMHFEGNSGRWCSGIPGIHADAEHCRLPVAGRIGGSCD